MLYKMSENTKTLKELYSEAGFPAAAKFSQFLKKEGIKISQEEVKKFLASQSSEQLHKVVKKTKNGKPITAPDPGIEIMIDLLDMTKFAKKNKGNNWILIASDVFSKKAYAEPVKSKEPKNVLIALKSVLAKTGNPEVISSDQGGEFKGVVGEYLADHKITHRTAPVGDHKRLGVIDNFSKRLKNTLYKSFTSTGETEWMGSLQKFMAGYNKTPNMNLCGDTPNEAEERPIDTTNCTVDRITRAKEKRSNTQAEKSPLQVGDLVRVKVQGNVFKKGYTQRWGTDIRTIEKKEGNWFILDDDSRVKAENLLKVQKVAEEEAVKDVAGEAQAEHKQATVLKSEDIKEENVQRRKRDWKPTERILRQKGSGFGNRADLFW
jgi:hypothetical protein